MTQPPARYRCASCGQEHDELEPGFRRPDAFFAVPQSERAARVRESDDLCVIDGTAHFVRAVAPLNVRGRGEAYQWGLWVKVSKEAFADYLELWEVAPPPGHLGYQATVANQCALVPPLLGTPVRVTLGQLGRRPDLWFEDERHLFGRLQREGVGPELVAEWSWRTRHPHDPRPAGAAFLASLEQHGWAVLRPDEVGRTAHPFARPPAPGDLVKAAFAFLAADAAGTVSRRVEAMWVELDAPAAGSSLTGTLRNHPTVPGPLDAGTRVFLDASGCLAHQPAGAG